MKAWAITYKGTSIYKRVADNLPVYAIYPSKEDALSRQNEWHNDVVVVPVSIIIHRKKRNTP